MGVLVSARIRKRAAGTSQTRREEKRQAGKTIAPTGWALRGLGPSARKTARRPFFPIYVMNIRCALH